MKILLNKEKLTLFSASNQSLPLKDGSLLIKTNPNIIFTPGAMFSIEPILWLGARVGDGGLLQPMNPNDSFEMLKESHIADRKKGRNIDANIVVKATMGTYFCRMQNLMYFKFNAFHKALSIYLT